MCQTLEALRPDNIGSVWKGPEISYKKPVKKSKSKKEIIYPDSDGKPMSDNTKQFRWIVKIKEGLEILFADRPDVFVAGDLLWYPVEGDNKIRVAPDAMVVFGRPKGDRGSYRQWVEDDISPQVVFEVLSPGNTKKEMKKKLAFYDKYLVEEYYIYDPDNITFEGWIRLKDDKLHPIKNIQSWVSPRLKIRFELNDKKLSIFRPDGQKFLTPLEQKQQADEVESQLKLEKQRATQQKQRADKEKKRADQVKSQLKLEKQRAAKEKQRADQAENQAKMLAAKLKELGISLK
ncbi:putative restriction endonuclease domain-containing protein [Candidatus Magnetomoraceae bacterium gMMP-15]